MEVQGIYYYYYVRWVAIRQPPSSEVCYVRGGLGARTLAAFLMLVQLVLAAAAGCPGEEFFGHWLVYSCC